MTLISTFQGKARATMAVPVSLVSKTSKVLLQLWTEAATGLVVGAGGVVEAMQARAGVCKAIAWLTDPESKLIFFDMTFCKILGLKLLHHQ